MIAKIKKSYYIDKEDKKKIRIYLVEHDMNYTQLSMELGISSSLFGAIMNGTRPLTTNTIGKLREIGIDLGENNEN